MRESDPNAASGPPLEAPARYFDCTAPDQAMYAVGKLMPSSIHVRVDLERPLDAARLALAWRRLPEVHPILGCTLSRPTLFPRWRPGRVKPRELVEEPEQGPDHPGGPGPAELRLLNEDVDVRSGTPARLALLSRGNDTQRLLVTVNHAAMDARSVVTVTKALRALYGALARDPDLALTPDYSVRSMVEVFRQQGVTSKQRRQLVRAQQRRESQLGRSHHRDPRTWRGIVYRRGTLTYREWVLEPGLLDALERRRREAGWSLNDVLLGLIARGWAQAMGAGARGHRRQGSVWLATADARPWFGVQGGLGNLSCLEPVGLPGVELVDAPGAVQIAHDAMAERKTGRLGLGGHLLGRWLRWVTPPGLFNVQFRVAARLMARLAGYNRAFTNIGDLGDELRDWDGVTATHATVIAPLPLAPLTIVTGSGFNRRVSLVVGFRQGWLTDAQLDAMHDALRADLASFGGSAPT